MIEQRKNQTVTKLHEILRPFLLRRVKLDVLKEMPPKKEVVVYSGMSKLQLGYADLIEKGVLRDELLRQGIMDGKNLSQTNKMMNQRKNVNHPFMFGEPLDPASGAHIGTVYPQLLVRASGKFALMDRMLERLHKGAYNKQKGSSSNRNAIWVLISAWLVSNFRCFLFANDSHCFALL